MLRREIVAGRSLWRASIKSLCDIWRNDMSEQKREAYIVRRNRVLGEDNAEMGFQMPI